MALIYIMRWICLNTLCLFTLLGLFLVEVFMVIIFVFTKMLELVLTLMGRVLRSGAELYFSLDAKFWEIQRLATTYLSKPTR